MIYASTKIHLYLKYYFFFINLYIFDACEKIKAENNAADMFVLKVTINNSKQLDVAYYCIDQRKFCLLLLFTPRVATCI